MFDIGLVKLALLLALALIVFGPDRLPVAARQAAQTLRRLRRLAQNATDEINAELGLEHADLADVHPRRFVTRHLLADDRVPRDDGPLLPYGERPPFDADAT